MTVEDFPPMPRIESVDWEPPASGPRVVRKTTADHLKIHLTGPDGQDGGDVSDVLVPIDSIPVGEIGLLGYADNQPAADYTLTLRSYWVPVPGSYTRVYDGGEKQITTTTTSGITTTDSSTISAELGVDVGGLSAKISASFGQSVETSNQTSQEVTHSIGSPEKGYVRVWMMWQLVDEIVALGADGNVIANPTRAVTFAFRFPPMPGVPSPYDQGVGSTVYQNIEQAFPSMTYVPAQKDFPDESMNGKTHIE